MKQRADGRWVKVKVINGKSISFYSKKKTEKAALKDIESQMLKYVEEKSKKMLFKDIAIDWKYEHMENLSYKTWQGYSAHYNRALKEFGELYISEIQTADIQLFITGLAKQKYAFKTVKHALNVISLIFDFAIMKKQLSQNPCDYVKIPQGLERKERELPSEEEIQKVINSTNCHFGTFAYLLLFTGLRRGEALALHSDNIDFEKNIININQSVYFKSNRPELKEPKTKAGYRQVYLIDRLKPLLEGKKGFIFGGDSPMTEQAFRRAWERYIKESGVNVTPHQLRHAYATMLYDSGIEAKSAQRLLGHSDIKITLQTYTHISESRQKNDFEKLNSWSIISQKSDNPKKIEET